MHRLKQANDPNSFWVLILQQNCLNPLQTGKNLFEVRTKNKAWLIKYLEHHLRQSWIFYTFGSLVHRHFWVPLFIRLKQFNCAEVQQSQKKNYLTVSKIINFWHCWTIFQLLLITLYFHALLFTLHVYSLPQKIISNLQLRIFCTLNFFPFIFRLFTSNKVFPICSGLRQLCCKIWKQNVWDVLFKNSVKTVPLKSITFYFRFVKAKCKKKKHRSFF